MQSFLFERSTWNFKDEVARILGVKDLERLYSTELGSRMVTRETDQTSYHYRTFYNEVSDDDHPFRLLYDRFVWKLLSRSIFQEPLVYQRIPNLRIQYLENRGVGEFHCDSQYGHCEEEINIYMPLTRAMNTATIWVESEVGKGDYKPMNVEGFGHAIIWDGAHLKHGNYVNRESYVRVSLDFRVIRQSNFKPSTAESINTHMKFDIGGYYKEMTDGTKRHRPVRRIR